MIKLIRKSKKLPVIKEAHSLSAGLVEREVSEWVKHEIRHRRRNVKNMITNISMEYILIILLASKHMEVNGTTGENITVHLVSHNTCLHLEEEFLLIEYLEVYGNVMVQYLWI